MIITRTGATVAVVLASGLFTSAMAGGFARGAANTDILYEDGKFAANLGFTWVAPGRDYDTINGVKSDDGPYSNNFFIPDFAVKVRLTDNLSCAGTYTQSFGGSSDYGADTMGTPFDNQTISTEFTSNELGATCAAKFGVGKGNAYLLGGVFMQTFDYTEKAEYGTLHLEDDSAFGYRLGVAYDIPDYALRAQLMYRSAVDHEATGDFTVSDLLSSLKGLPAGMKLNSFGTGTLPQSVKLSVQSGVAPTWLVYGSVEWMDWSVLQNLNYTIDLLGPQKKNFYYKDGWAVQAGVAHQFNETVAGTVNLTWEKGVGTGADLASDSWTLGVGSQIKVGPGAITVGAGASYLTATKQYISKGADYDATSDGDWAFALQTSYLIKF